VGAALAVIVAVFVVTGVESSGFSGFSVADVALSVVVGIED
jgi:hypothetical protein